MSILKLNSKICLSSLELLGDFWSLRLIDALSEGELRYCELQRRAGNVNPVTLTTKLKKLQNNKIIARNEQSRGEVVYSLTPLGKKALPILVAVNEFSAAAR